MDNRFNPAELVPKGRAYVVRENERGRGLDIIRWDVLNGLATWPMSNVRNMALPQWRRLAEHPEDRCLIPLNSILRVDVRARQLGRRQEAVPRRDVVRRG